MTPTIHTRTYRNERHDVPMTCLYNPTEGTLYMVLPEWSRAIPIENRDGYHFFPNVHTAWHHVDTVLCPDAEHWYRKEHV